MFQLHSDYAPTGDQPQAIAALTEGLERGLKHQVLLGVTGSGKTFTVANVIANAGKPTLILSHNKTLAAQLYEEMRGFFPENAVEYYVSYYDYYQPEAYLPTTDTYIEKDHIFVSTHTRSFIDDDMAALSRQIADTFKEYGAQSEVVMSAPAWQEDQQSPFLQLVNNTFQDVLGWRPRMVAMHFVLEAGFFVQHYPGIQIASIGPRIVEPHSTSERVELSTIEDIWKVLIELLKRL